MSLFLKQFETTAQYEAYTADTANFITPNVSVCNDAPTTVYYSPYVEPSEARVVTKYNVTDTSNPTRLCDSSVISQFSAIEIDGVTQPSVVNAYTFSTTGEHTVKYTLTDSTTIGDMAFMYCNSLTSIVIPDSVTTIGSDVFTNCRGLTSCTIGSGVTSIGGAFLDCYGLTSIVSNATTAPTITSFTFCNIKTGGTLTVPAESTGYDVWMQNANYYLGLYNWKKVEQ